MTLMQRFRKRPQPPQPAGPDLLAESAARRAAAGPRASAAERERYSAAGITWLRAEDIPEPYGVDPIVFGPRYGGLTDAELIAAFIKARP